MQGFGPFIRRQRETLRADDPRFSVRQLAVRIGVEPSYLSKVERELEPPPSEPKIRALANELGEDPDSLLARAGKVSADLQEAITQAFIDIAATEDGAALLDELYEIDGLVPVPEGSYDIIRDLETELADLLS